MALEFRRGKDHMVKQERGTSDYRPFLTNFFWKDDKESKSKYLWILNPADDIPKALILRPFTKDGRPELVIARQEPTIGERTDPIEDEWGYGPAENNLCIAVELEPQFKVEQGRQRPVGFEVKTRTFERRVRDENGELTEEREEVESPVVGLIAQSPSNFFNQISFVDTTEGPVHEFPLQITRIGKGTDTQYNVKAFVDQPLDKTGLLETWEGISYLTSDEQDELFAAIDELDDDEAAIEIGNVLLNKRLNEMADLDYYNAVLANIDTKSTYPSQKYKDAHGGKAETKKTERPKRQSQRRTRQTEETPVDPDNDLPGSTEAYQAADQPGTVDPEPEERPKRQRRKAAEKTETTASTVTKDSPIRDRMEYLKSLKADAASRAKA